VATLAIVPLLLPGRARACKCVDIDSPTLQRPSWPQESGLILSSESIELDCITPVECQWRSVHVFTREASGEPARALLVLPFNGSDDLSVTFGGRVMEHDLEHEREADANGLHYWLEDDGQRTTVELVIEGQVRRYGDGRRDGWYAPQCCHFTALEVRHPFVPTYMASNFWDWFDESADAEVVPANAWTRVRVRAAPKLSVEVDGRARRANEDDVELAVPSQSELRIVIEDRGRLKGGPFVAVGGALLDANPVRGRIGWEHTHPVPFLFYSAALETDFREELTVAPAIEISHGRSSQWWMLPCAGFGLGVPIQILPDVRPGIRVQASLSWRVLSFLTTFDTLPAIAEQGRIRRIAFLGQLSF
jgi:hypothetical protein